MRLPSALGLSLLLALRVSAATFVVNSVGDAPDATPGNGACATAGAACTLRAAIEEANALADADTIVFGPGGTGTINVGAPLVVTAQVTIDGTLAAGYVPGTPVVIVNGGGTIGTGMAVIPGAHNSTIRGLQFTNFTSSAVNVVANNVTIRQNFFGPGNEHGLSLNASGAQVGGPDDGDGNVASGNRSHGMMVTGSNHEIRDNIIGLTYGGAAMPNGSHGVLLYAFATNVTLGGFSPGVENVISANLGDGIRLLNAHGNRIASNYVGTGLDGLTDMGNAGNGIYLTFGSSNNQVGNGDAYTVIAGNGGAGVLFDQSSTGNVIQNSVIGLGRDGDTVIPNDVGVQVLANGNTVGTGNSGNVISGNVRDGVEVGQNISGTTINANTIGLNSASDTMRGNGRHGIYLQQFSGGTAIGSEQTNVISGNGGFGIYVETVTNAAIHNNVIGLFAGADSAAPNANGGIYIGSSNVTLGAAATPNVISGNTGSGIMMVTSSNVMIEGNFVGTSWEGLAAVPNVGEGLTIINSEDNVVRQNVISGNTAAGIGIYGTSRNNSVRINLIGVAAGNTGPLPNGAEGVLISEADENVIGTATEPNLIGRNGGAGVAVTGDAIDNRIEYNGIFANGGLGIDLARDGVTPNDAGDADSGPNALQNFPVVASAVTGGGSSQISGTINTTPASAVRIFVYGSPSADPSGFGEGNVFLASTDVTTDAGGNAYFNLSLPFQLSATARITATATNGRNSSEFSGSTSVLVLPTVTLSSATYTANEGAATATITITRSGDLTAGSSVDYVTSDGTATAGSDYAATSGTATFAPGAASTAFDIPVIDDAVDDNDETMTITLANPSGALLGTPETATLTIVDDDAPPAISIGDVTQAEGNAGTTNFVFTVTLTAPSSLPVAVDYATANGTAIAGSDYSSAGGTVTIPAGETSRTITVAVLGDSTIEPNETFLVNLSNATNATIADAQATGTMTNDDQAPAEVPTLSEWMLLVLAGMLGLFAIGRLR